MDNSRRAFLKKSCILCASFVGVSLVLPALTACSTMQTLSLTSENNVFKVNTNAFLEGEKIVLINSKTLEFPIALVKNSETDYKAFEMQCTHQVNPLIATKNGFFCNAHGSSFTLDGKVKNAPAISNLKEYKTTIIENEILINI